MYKQSKRKLLDLHYNSRKGHLGGNLSCFDIMYCLFHKIMRDDDRFILSKGHSAGALYVMLWSKSLISDDDLDSFCREGTKFPAHPSGVHIPNLLFPTGSLGHGASLACGMALSAKLTNTPRHIYCLCSDGEWQEGSTWEALIFAVHHQLDNLTIVIDKNGWQGFGKTADVASMDNLQHKINAFGVDAIIADGHNHHEIIDAFNIPSIDRPQIIIFNTIKGKDTELENTLSSHYLPFTENSYRDAINKMETL